VCIVCEVSYVLFLQDSRMTQLEAEAEEEVEEEHHSEVEAGKWVFKVVSPVLVLTRLFMCIAEAVGNGATENATKHEVDENVTEDNDHHSVESD